MFELGPIGIEIDAPVTAHPTLDSLRALVSDLVTVRSSRAYDPATGLMGELQPQPIDRDSLLQDIAMAIQQTRDARLEVSPRRIQADPNCAEAESKALEAYLAASDSLLKLCTELSSAMNGDRQAIAGQLMERVIDHFQFLQRDWISFEFRNILDDPLQEKSLPADPYRWVLGIPTNPDEPATKGLRFSELTSRQEQAIASSRELQEAAARFAKLIQAGDPNTSTKDLLEVSTTLYTNALALARFAPAQMERINIYRGQLLHDLPTIDGHGVDPAIYVFARDVCTLKAAAAHKLFDDARNIAQLAMLIESYAMKGSSGPIPETDQKILVGLAEDLQFLSIGAAARLRLSDPLYLGTQRYSDGRPPIDPLLLARARAGHPLPPDRSYFEAWGLDPVFRVIDSRLPRDAMNVALRSANYGTKEEGILWPIYQEAALKMMAEGDPLGEIDLMVGEGGSICRKVIPTISGSALLVRQYRGATVDGWKIEPTRPHPQEQIQEQADLLKEHARLELNAKGTTLGDHPIRNRLAIKGASFVTLEDLERRELGFSYLFTDPAFFPDHDEFEQIPKELLPPGRPARPNLIVIDDKVAAQVENGAAYSAITEVLETIAREAGCDYMIARVNLHGSSRGWRAAERRGWQKIDAYVTGSGLRDGKPESIQQQWIVKELY